MNRKSMKVLVVMVNYPFPPRTGSSIVAYNSMKYLSKQHRIDLVCLQPLEDLLEPAVFVERVDLVTQKKISQLAKWVRYLSYMLMGEPPSVSAYASRSMKNKVRSEIEGGKYDAILMFEMSAIQYCPYSSFHKLIVNIEDPQSIKLRRMADLPIWSLWQKVKFFASIRLTASYESRHLHKLARVLLLSEADVHDMSKEGSYNNLAHMPYGVDQRDLTEIAGYEDRERTIIFSGSMYHPPNVDGALFLINDILPLILQVHPSATLLIVGADPDDRIFEAAAKFGKQIVITGKVDDIAGYIKRASVSICPVRLKIGVQTKILEALSWGTPVVTTSAGNGGIGGISGTHFWVEDEPLQFAQKVVELLQGRGWATLSEEGRNLVIERFSWEGSVAQLEQQIESVVASNL